MTGAAIGDREFPTTHAGYAAAVTFLHSMGHVERIGVEGPPATASGSPEHSPLLASRS
jgi:hypothetical protein